MADWPLSIESFCLVTVVTVKRQKKVTSLNISPHLFLLFTLLSGKTRNGNSHSRLPLLEDMPRATAQCHAIDVLTHIHHLFHITQCAGTHTLGHHKNGPLLSRSHSKHTDVFPWGAHPPLTVDIHLVLKILRLIYLCCMFPAWFLTWTVKTGSNEVWHPKDLPSTSVTLRLLSYEDV